MRKGVVIPMSEVLPPKEFSKIAGMIQESISNDEKELEELKWYEKENRELFMLVQGLPGDVSHKIMVPFGKAAFFPGKLVHTNEMLVYLGNGYYAERSARQTLDILSRRFLVIRSGMEKIHNDISNLRAKASFNKNTAEESVEGIVNIIEEYVDPSYLFPAPGEVHRNFLPGSKKPRVSDEEHKSLMARLSELEAQEEAAEKESNEDSFVELMRDDSSDNEEEESWEDVSSSAPVPRTPADLVQFEERKKQACDQAEDSSHTSGDKIEKRVSFNLPHSQETKPHQVPGKQKEPNKAFSGVVVERSYEDDMTSTTKEENEASKPVSRFKQRRA